MKILLLSEDVSDYGAAFYQRDFINCLDNTHTVELYGPGTTQYNNTDTIDDVISKCEFTPDLICIGHKWLGDTPNTNVNPHPPIDLNNTSIPCTIILNKEYTNFEEKIAYIESNNIPLVFTHHHKADQWLDEYDPEFIFWPFAVNATEFKDYGEDYQYDLSFSGRLRNPNPDVPQTDVRIRAQQELYYSIGQLKLIRRPQYRDYSIFFRGRPTSEHLHRISKVLHREQRLPDEDYKRLYNRSKLSFNTLSPIDLVGTRYYESMASKSLAFCQESSIYTEYDLFEPGTHCVTFSDDLSDFHELLQYYVDNDEEREAIAKAGHDHVHENHTWEKRVEQFTEIVQRELL